MIAPNRPDVAIVGAGIVGCSTAVELASAGVEVTVFDRQAPGSGATGAAAGILSPQAETAGPGPLLDLFLEARDLYPRLVDQLRQETGRDVGYRTPGTILLAFDAEEEAELQRCHEWQSLAGLPVELLPAGRIHTLEPAVIRSVRMGLLLPQDHQVDNGLLIEALAEQARLRGVRFRIGEPVDEVVIFGGKLLGLHVGGERIECGAALIAAGCWSGQIGELPERLAVVPVRGQMIEIQSGPPVVEHVLFRSNRYLVPRADGRILVGSTQEWAAVEAEVTVAGIGGLIAHALEIVPALKNLPIRRTWAGLRPGTEDGLPILGASKAEGLFYATGLYRSGILLGPLVGRLAAQLILHGRASWPLEPFSPHRVTG